MELDPDKIYSLLNYNNKPHHNETLYFSNCIWRRAMCKYSNDDGGAGVVAAFFGVFHEPRLI